ncbi:tryptophan 7-halogenase [Aurantiacibacter poecillastricola]|uniref:tryptophan 7-halogenase n=1 Tax=Aurantiacibacter poecillastricola TaxID=3064385 RepID=UPI00273E5C11|nr:tryptophan 7-halogenase [Aurantiacibacter sp. 219JJ12-13]MDP5260262.1 tryptophan 7-halogenase [Aurantiacibacter sp. 219JJ12-13]
MSQPREPLRRIVVAGGGQVGVLTAIGLRRALPTCEVVVIGIASGLAAFADRASTSLPFTNKLHDRLGIEEAQLVLSAGGSYRLATHYVGWGGKEQHGIMPYGGASDPALQTRFAQQWGGGPRNVSQDRPAGSIAEALVEAGRFAPPPPDADTPISEVEYALRWNPPAYRNLLVDHARRAGVTHVSGLIAAIQPDGRGGIASIAIEGQGTIEADLFVDCSGPDAILASAMPEFDVAPWSDISPIRRVLVAPPGQAMLELEDRISLLSEGWLCELAGRDGLQTMLAIDDAVSDDAARAALQAEPAAVLNLSPGRAREAWIGNVIAMGDAAVRCEPLGFLPLDLAHRQLHLLLEMLPGRQIVASERAEYNRRAGLMFDAARDLLAMHYAAPRARMVFPDAGVPGTVRTTLDQFERRGRLPFQEEAPLLKQEQLALLGALGFARGLSTREQHLSERDIAATQADFAARSQAAVAFAPPYAQWLTSVLRANPAQTG